MAIAVDPRYVIQLQPARTARPTLATYRRRRLVAVFVLLAVLGVALISVQSVLTSHGGAPAVVPMASSAQAGPAPVVAADGALAATPAYVVQPGDTLWTIAQRFGTGNLSAYLDRLVESNGGATIQVGQVLALPG